MSLTDRNRSNLRDRKLSERSQRKNEASFRTLAESASDAIIAIDANSTIRFFNPAAEKIFGYKTHEVVGQKITMLMPENEREKHITSLKDYLQTGQKHLSWTGVEVVGLDRSGRELSLEISFGEFFLNGEHFFTGIVRDIAKREEAQESQSRLAAIVESSHDAITGKTLDGTIFSWNKGAEEVYGYTEEEVLGKSIEILVPPDRKDEIANILEMLRNDHFMDQFETERVRKDGERINVSLTFSPIKDRHGKTMGASVIARDITERKRAQERFQLALEAAPSGIIVSDKEGMIKLVNSQTERMFGYESRELIGQRIEMLLPESFRNSHPTLRKKFLQNPESRPMGVGRELFAVRKDGSEFPVEIGLNPIMRENGVEILAAVADITQRKQMEEERSSLEKQLQQTQKLESLAVLAGGIAHDFNNILTGILGNAELALMEVSPASSVLDYIDKIKKSAVRASELCKQMLAYSGKGRFLIQATDINHVIEEMTHLLRVSISKKAVINYELDPELPAVEADAVQIRQVVMNLITNASEAMGDKSGVITLRTGSIDCEAEYLAETFIDEGLEQGRYVYLEVTDTGCGMDKAVQDKIFDPFYTTKFTGHGLGLAAVLGIVRGHKGAIKVYSEKGIGTTFKILLPSLDKKAVRSSEEIPDMKGFQAEGRVLVIDDEESVREVVSRTLERVGLEVITAPDGRKGLDIFEKKHDKLSLVILDLTMPHMSGEEVFRKMRRIYPDVPVILTSGYNQQELTNRFAGKPFSGFLQKPLRPSLLLSKIKQVLEQ